MSVHALGASSRFATIAARSRLERAGCSVSIVRSGRPTIISIAFQQGDNLYLKLKAEGAPIEMQNGVVICLAQITTRQDPESGEIIYTWE